MRRRVQQQVFIHIGGWLYCPNRAAKCVYDGWNVVLTLNACATVTRKFTWGLDLSGALPGAGGLGGLLAPVEGSSYWYFYDGNGNVGG